MRSDQRIDIFCFLAKSQTMKSSPAPTVSNYLKTLSFLHRVITVTPLIMGILFYTQAQGEAFFFSVPRVGNGVLVPVLAIGSVLLGELLFKRMTRNFPKDGGLKEKLARYQSASLLKYALVEGAALFAMVIFANTWNLFHPIVGAMLIVHLFFQRPSSGKIEQRLRLRGAERAQFKNLDRPLV